MLCKLLSRELTIVRLSKLYNVDSEESEISEGIFGVEGSSKVSRKRAGFLIRRSSELRSDVSSAFLHNSTACLYDSIGKNN